MSREEQAFLQAIGEHPDDDGPRLMYADWLTEQGDPRGEFITIQCDLAGMNPADPRRPALVGRELDLLAAHYEAWTRPLRELGVMEVEYRRGLPEVIVLPAAQFLENAEALFARAPVRGARLKQATAGQIRQLAAAPHLTRLTELNLADNAIGDDGARLLAASPHLGNLTELNLGSNSITVAGVQALAAAPHLTNLTALNLADNDLGDEGVRALAESPHLRNVTRLNLEEAFITAAGVQALAAAPHLTNLTRLNLAHNAIGDDGARLLAASPHLRNVTRLNLWGSGLTAAGVQALAAAPHLTRLTELNLADNAIGDDGARLLAGSPNLQGLTRLKLSYTGIGPVGARALLAPHSHLTRLTELDLGANFRLGDAVLEEVNREMAARWARQEGRSL